MIKSEKKIEYDNNRNSHDNCLEIDNKNDENMINIINDFPIIELNQRILIRSTLETLLLKLKSNTNAININDTNYTEINDNQKEELIKHSYLDTNITEEVKNINKQDSLFKLDYISCGLDKKLILNEIKSDIDIFKDSNQVNIKSLEIKFDDYIHSLCYYNNHIVLIGLFCKVVKLDLNQIKIVSEFTDLTDVVEKISPLKDHLFVVNCGELMIINFYTNKIVKTIKQDCHVIDYKVSYIGNNLYFLGSIVKEGLVFYMINLSDEENVEINNINLNDNNYCNLEASKILSKKTNRVIVLDTMLIDFKNKYNLNDSNNSITNGTFNKEIGLFIGGDDKLLSYCNIMFTNLEYDCTINKNTNKVLKNSSLYYNYKDLISIKTNHFICCLEIIQIHNSNDEKFIENNNNNNLFHLKTEVLVGLFNGEIEKYRFQTIVDNSDSLKNKIRYEWTLISRVSVFYSPICSIFTTPLFKNCSGNFFKLTLCYGYSGIVRILDYSRLNKIVDIDRHKESVKGLLLK